MPQTEIWLKTGNQTARFENEQKNSTIFALAKGIEQLIKFGKYILGKSFLSWEIPLGKSL